MLEAYLISLAVGAGFGIGWWLAGVATGIFDYFLGRYIKID